MANFVLSGDPAPAKTRTCTLVFWCFVLPDVSPHAAVGRFLEDFWIMRFCYMHVYPGFLALCTSCDLLNKSIFTAIYCVCSVNESLFCSLWLLFTRFLSKKWFFWSQTQSKNVESARSPRCPPRWGQKLCGRGRVTRAGNRDDGSMQWQTPSNYLQGFCPKSYLFLEPNTI